MSNSSIPNSNSHNGANAESRTKAEAMQSLQYLIFDTERPNDWVQDVWGMSPMLGDTAAKLLEAFEAVVERCPDQSFDQLVQKFEKAVAEQENR
ncbi:MAG: hypothetical protein AAGD25_14525 [Cyanobacteria bacterium P01_F01_bin.150]